MSITSKLNDLRKEALKENLKGMAIDIQRVMMKHDRREAHQLLNRDRQKKGNAQSTQATEGRAKFYSSRSGETDIEELLETIPQGSVRAKKKTVVTESPVKPLQVVKQNSVEALASLSDEELDQVFGGIQLEKDWIESEGYTIHPNAKADTTRKRTRMIFAELLAKDEEE